MYINKKEAVNKKIPMRQQVNSEIRNIARRRLAAKDLSPTARQILEEIVETNMRSRNKAA